MCGFEKYSSEDAGVGVLSQRSWAASGSGGWAREMVVVIDTLLVGSKQRSAVSGKGNIDLLSVTAHNQASPLQFMKTKIQGNTSVLAEACVAGAQKQMAIES